MNSYSPCDLIGGIGSPLSLLLKQNKLVSELSLYDLNPATIGK